MARGSTDCGLNAFAAGAPVLKAGFNEGSTNGNGACGSERALAVESNSGELSVEEESASDDAAADELFAESGRLAPLEA